MAFRSKVRLSPVPGILLTTRCIWYLHRRQRPPGIRGPYRRKLIGYRLRPRGKWRLRREYDIRERQLRRALAAAVHRTGGTPETAENLVELLEQRLDALVWRAGFAPTIHQARDMVGSNHFTVDGRKMNRPAYRLQPGQTIAVRDSRRDKVPFVLVASRHEVQGPPPPYLDVRPAQLRATLTREPRSDEVPALRGEELVVEPYPR